MTSISSSSSTGGGSLDYWRDYFRRANSDIFGIIEHAIMVAASDCPKEFKIRREKIAQLLFSCGTTRYLGCDRVELAVSEVLDSNTNVGSYGDAEALTGEIEEANEVVEEVLRIKKLLLNFKDESDSVLVESLRRLQLMALNFDILKTTDIGKAVNDTRRGHTSKEIRYLARSLIDRWKIVVDEWVKATQEFTEGGTSNSVNPSKVDEEEGLPSPPLDDLTFVSTQAMDFSQFFDAMDDDGNPRNCGELNKYLDTRQRKPLVAKQDPPERGEEPPKQAASLTRYNKRIQEKLETSKRKLLEIYQQHLNDAVEKETLFGKRKNKRNSKWTILAQALRAIMNLRILNGQKLYCCLFPSDYEFERETLVQLWMGLLQQPWEHDANRRFDRLLNGNYIYKSRTDILTGRNKYKIDAAKFTSHFNMLKNRDHYTMIGDENIGVDISKAWHVSVASKSIDETVFKTLEGSSGLRSVLFIHDYGSSLKQIPSTFFTTLPYMQVLDLSGSHISELPSSIGNMTRLYFLDLSCTLIKRIPESIRLLQELQTLILRGCKHLHKLPKGMKELVNLYHLDFDVLGQLTSMPKGLGSLTRLRMLSAFIVSEEDGCSLRELKDMNNLCGSLCISGLEYATGEDAMKAAMQNKMHLTRLHFKWNDSKCYNDNDRNLAYSTLQSLCPHYSSLVELQISYYPGYTLPTWIQHPELMHLVSITFLRCENETLIVRERLPNLRHLNIYEMNRVTYIGSKGHLNVARFPKLETVTIDGMLNLQGLTEVQVGDYPCLSKVSIKRCPKLTELPVLPFLGSLTYLEIRHCKSIKSLPEGKLPTLLETLMIGNCPLLKPRCSKDGEDWEKIKHVPNIWIDMKDIRHEDTDSLSEDEYESSDDSD